MVSVSRPLFKYCTVIVDAFKEVRLNSSVLNYSRGPLYQVHARTILKCIENCVVPGPSSFQVVQLLALEEKEEQTISTTNLETKKKRSARLDPCNKTKFLDRQPDYKLKLSGLGPPIPGIRADVVP
jgi:hypothetical protein